MLFNNVSATTKQNPLSLPHKGIVKDNEDPLKLGRVRCEIPGRWETKKEWLPWCESFLDTGLGGKKELSNLIIPELDTELIIKFDHDSLYHPMFYGRWHNDLTHNSLFDGSYPEEYGFIDSVMEWFRVNKKEEFLEFFRATKEDTFRLDKDGNIWLNIPKNLILNVKGSMFLNVASKKVVKAGSDSTETVGGNYELKVSGTAGRVSGGNMSDEAPNIHHNSGIVFNTTASTNAELDAKVSELSAKVAELATLAAALKVRQATAIT